MGRNSKSVATQLIALVLRTLQLPDRLLLVIDDSPTKRYGPYVEGADVHHNPTPGPAGQPFLYGHVWVAISLALRHPRWGPLALPLRAMLYVRKQTTATIPSWRRWYRFATKLQLAARLVEWIVPILKKSGKTVWVVVDGGYTKAPFLKRVLKLSGVVVVGRLRKDAALRDLPPKLKKGQRRGRGRPRIAFTVKWRQEQNQSGQASWTDAWLANGRLHCLRSNSYEDFQDLPGNLPPRWQCPLCQCEWGA